MIWEKLVSKTVKEHWKKVSYEPSDALKAAIIYNYVSLQTVQDACRCLRERHEEENKIKCFMARFDV